MAIRFARTLVMITALLLTCGSTIANDGDVSRHAEALKEISDLVDAGRYDDALVKINDRKNILEMSNYVDRLYLVYLNAKEGYAYYRLGDMCRSESAYLASLSGVRQDIKRSDDIFAQNYTALGRIYIEMNDGQKEQDLLLEISNFVNKSISVGQVTMFSLVRVMLTMYIDLGDVDRAERLLDGLSSTLISKVMSKDTERRAFLNLLTAAIQQRKGNNENARQFYEMAFNELGINDDDENKNFPVELADFARLMRSLGDKNESARALKKAEIATRRSKRNAEQAVLGIIGRSRSLGTPGLLCDGAK